MEELLKRQFNLQKAEIKKLDGYDNLNYRVKTEHGSFIFKTYKNSPDTLDLVKAENDTLLHLQLPGSDLYPTPIPFQDGAFIKQLEIDGETRICRMLSFLEGQFFGDASQTAKLFQSFGRFLAKLNKRLQTFNNYVIKSRCWEWNITDFELNRKYLHDIPDAKKRKIVEYFFQQYKENVYPKIPALRKSVIHNDANEWNVLVTEGEVSGLIDFGDLAHSVLVSDLAIGIAYACYDKDDPLQWASHIISSYHSALPIEEEEIAILYYLIATKMCISVCNSAHSSKANPDNSYATSSEEKAWALLAKWVELGPIKAENVFRSAIGLIPKEVKSEATMLKDRHQSIGSTLSISYNRPIYMKRAAFQYMYDANGNSYLDAYNNIPQVGHAHPKVVEAGQRQLAKLNTNTRYLYDSLNIYAHQLLAKFPSSLSKVYFVNSGSAASDLAIRMVHAHVGHKRLMVMEHGYHGNTQLGIDISDYKFSHTDGQGQKDHIIKTTLPDTYRGKYEENDGSAGMNYATDAMEQLKNTAPIAAFISEPIVGCGGQVPLAKGYLKALYPEIRRQGGLCISDEVQTGFGRLGDHFWGFEAQEVVPDLVILGKPMGNGHPIGAVVCTEEVSESFSRGVEFFSSFGGNPVSCAIGAAVLDVIEEEQLQRNAMMVGEYYQSLLRDLMNEFSCIGDVRGSGLFIGVEFITNPETKNPNTKLAQLIKNELRERNILVSTDGPFDSVIKSKPPLCFTKENAEQVVASMRKVLLLSSESKQ